VYLETLPSLYVGTEFNGRLSSEATGIIATLLTTSQLSREFCADCSTAPPVRVRPIAVALSVAPTIRTYATDHVIACIRIYILTRIYQ
jgi:hypothetical protein